MEIKIKNRYDTIEKIQEIIPQFKTKHKPLKLSTYAILLLSLSLSFIVIYIMFVLCMYYFYHAQKFTFEFFQFITSLVTTVFFAIIPLIQNAFYHNELKVKDNLADFEKKYIKIVHTLNNITDSLVDLLFKIKDLQDTETYCKECYKINTEAMRLCDDINSIEYLHKSIAKKICDMIFDCKNIMEPIMLFFRAGHDKMIQQNIENSEANLSQKLMSANNIFLAITQYLDAVYDFTKLIIGKKYTNKKSNQLSIELCEFATDVINFFQKP